MGRFAINGPAGRSGASPMMMFWSNEVVHPRSLLPLSLVLRVQPGRLALCPERHVQVLQRSRGIPHPARARGEGNWSNATRYKNAPSKEVGKWERDKGKVEREKMKEGGGASRVVILAREKQLLQPLNQLRVRQKDSPRDVKRDIAQDSRDVPEGLLVRRPQQLPHAGQH